MEQPFRLERTLRVTSLDEAERTRPSLRYWQSRPPQERLAAVEFLRRQVEGTDARLKRVLRLVDCPWG